jgi:hypothetical protein
MAGIQSKIALGCALMLGVTAPLVAQNEHQELVSALLDAAEELAAENGFSSTHSRYNGALDEGREDTITIDLDAGTSYFIVGQCDIDCSDIDLTLHDENGNLIDEDVLLDDTPIVEVTPIRNARFTLTMTMVDCESEPCYYGIGVFGQ